MADAFHELRAKYLEAQLRGSRRDAIALLVDGLSHGVSPLDMQRYVVQEAQAEIGRLWQENRISIAEEHMATAVSQVALSYLYERAERGVPNGKRVTVACVEGELHDFPARLVADALDLAGFDVDYLGANVPTESLTTFLEQRRPDLVALSVTMTFNGDALRAAVASVREHFPGLPIAVGGGACTFDKNLAERVRADITAEGAYDLVGAARGLLQVHP